MLDIKTSIVVALLSLTINGASAAGCNTGAGEQSAQNNKQTKNRSVTPGPSPVERENVDSKIKILGQGAHNQVSEAFVAVARDAQTYQELRRLDDNLPVLDDGAFHGMAVVAAFLGQRRTGGYGVEITRAADGTVRIIESSPPKDSMTTQVLTTPYKVVSISIENERTLKLDLGKTWQASLRPYRITSGDFTMSGGFAGRTENFRLEGGFNVMREGSLATFIYDIKSAGAAQSRELKEATTGIVKGGGEVSLARFNAGSLVEPPVNLLGAKGQFTGNESDLTLSFESLPSTVADGYKGKGSLTATATAPAPAKKALPRQDVM